jgi:hypothetical protein
MPYSVEELWEAPTEDLEEKEAGHPKKWNCPLFM